ncbi:unnamed protein product [Ceutorhynchus assimilis]|uniref:RNA transcription, translation and transport factor protein n=1 Tax=Ceutorhynchus assimilis TaxID=467358 RepID=A0A9N9QDU5_9CUCU|nr:unnamed protein product [Ceutorhynchus assimilis]
MSQETYKGLIKYLDALEYPDSQNLNFSNEKTVREIVLWLETNKLKSAKSSVLKGLQSQNSEEWNKHFEEYTGSCGGFSFNSPLEKLHWLLAKALCNEYAKNKQLYNSHAVEKIKASNVPKVVAENPLDRLDYSTQESKDRINELAKLLKITPSPDHLVTLSAVRKVICSRLSLDCAKNPENVIVKGTPFPYKEVPMGKDFKDPSLNEAVKILQLLNIGDIRDLQTKASELIVTKQKATADPKTDTKIGKVGVNGK